MAALILSFATLAWLGVLTWQVERRHRTASRRARRLTSRVELVTRLIQRIAARDAERRLAREGRSSAGTVRFTSQHAEDVLLAELFDGRVGFFVEAGALDGVEDSNTYALEAMGWTGLLVEPIPELAERCAVNRPGCRVEQAALSEPGHAPTGAFNHYVGEGQLAGSRLDDPRNRRARGPRGSKASARRLDVRLATLDELLVDVDRVNLLALDVEGHEIQALRGLSLDRYRPEVILVEDHSLGRDDSLARYLDERGYEHCGWIAWNRLCVRRDEPELLARARDLLGTA